MTTPETRTTGSGGRQGGPTAGACWLAIALLSASAGQAFAADTPHWRLDRCDACHVDATPVAGASALKGDRPDQSCATCHDGLEARRCGHRSPFAPSAAIAGSMPPTYAAAMVDGEVTCTTCHDLAAQCLPQRREERYANHTFLRDGPFRDPATQCFVCHQGSAYRKLNPHRQVSRKAGVNRETCLLCHVKLPVSRAPGGSDAGPHLAGDPLAICSGCHPMAPHPGFNNARKKGTSGWSHLVQPPPAMLKFMQVKAVATGVRLPLEPESGRIVCTTCHDPHDADLAEYAHVRAPEPGDHKLRTQNICGGCHEIQ